MDYTQILDETKNILGSFMAEITVNKMGNAFEEQGPSYRDRSMNNTFLSSTTSALSLNKTDTTLDRTSFGKYSAKVGTNSTMVTRLNESFASIIMENFRREPVEKIEKFIEVISFEVSIAKSSQESLKRVLLQYELNTWRQLLLLLQTRNAHEPVKQFNVQSVLENNYSDQTIVNELHQCCLKTKEMLTLISWLEITFVNPFDAPPAGFVHLENTFRNCLGKKTNSFFFHLDSEIDGSNVDTVDKNNSSVFLRYAFNLIRGGNWDALENYSLKMGFTWLSALLEGRKYYHDPNYSLNSSSKSQLATTGNNRMKLWRKVCRTNCKNPKIDLYERAIYAYCCGHLDVLLSVSKTWEDRLWSILRCCLVKSEEYQIELLKNSASGGDEFLLEEPNIDFIDIIKQIEKEKELKSKQDYVIAFFNKFQKAIVLNDFDQLALQTIHLLNSVPPTSQLSTCCFMMNRFSACFWITVCELLDLNLDEYMDVTIRSYCDKLVSARQLMMVPVFITQCLNPESLCCELAINLSSVETEGFLAEAAKRGINVTDVRKRMIAQFGANYNPKSSDETLSVGQATEHEKKLVETVLSIKNTVNPLEFICHVNALGRKLIGAKQYSICLELYDNVPERIIFEEIYRHNGSMRLNCTQLNKSGVRMESVNEWGDLEAVLTEREKFIISEFSFLSKAVYLISDIQALRQIFNNNCKDFGTEKTSLKYSSNDSNFHCNISVELLETGKRDLNRLCGDVKEYFKKSNSGWLYRGDEEMHLKDDYFTEERTRQLVLIKSLLLPDIVLELINLLSDYSLNQLMTDFFVTLMSNEHLNPDFSHDFLQLLHQSMLNKDVLT